MEEISQKPIETMAKPRRIPKNPFPMGNSLSPGRPRLTAEMKLLKRAAVQEARRILQDHAPKAARNITQLADKARQEAVKLNANRDVLDRAGVLTQREPDKEGMNITLILNSFKVEKHENN